MKDCSIFGRRCVRYLTNPKCLLFINYFCLNWGYRMWFFSLGLFFMVIGDVGLLLAAVYGFIMGGSVLLFGGLIGDWIDRSDRLQGIRKSLLIQKTSTALCASLICVLLWFNITNSTNASTYYLLIAAILFLATTSELATMAYMRIQLQKDWFIVVADSQQDTLATINAVACALDMITNIVTPILTGQIMTSMSKFIAAICIAVWHVLSIFIENFLLTKIYYKIPKMYHKNATKESDGQSGEVTSSVDVDGIKETSSMNPGITNNTLHRPARDHQVATYSCHTFTYRLFSAFIIMVKGWRVYRRQVVFLAGGSLALLYITVLGFDSITIGYIYSSGLEPNVIGVITAMGSIAGVIGSFLFTRIRKYIGLERTGLCSYSWQLTCIALCVISVWLPGSTFKPSALWSNVTNCTQHTNHTANHCITGDPSNVSITVFLVGLCCSRLGLYMSDLVIGQLQQENVAECERGVVNGVQNSLNHLVVILKFILVMLVPRVETFGYLIMSSFTFIFIGACCYSYFCYQILQQRNASRKCSSIDI